MKEFSGILFLDKDEIILRIYQTDGKEWRLLHYVNKTIIPPLKTTTALAIIEVVTEMLSHAASQHVSEWRVCSRDLPEQIINTIALATGLPIEQLYKHREQELLCKGIFTELW